jgi:hypothetical protein
VKIVPITFSPTSSKGEQPQLGGARLVNAIAAQMEDGRIIIKRAPGLVKVFESVDSRVHCRGMVPANTGVLFVVYDGRVQSVTRSGGVYTVEDRGELAGVDLVTMARNNAATPDVVGVSSTFGAFVLTTGGAPAAYPDADVGIPVSTCFTGGYFFFPNGDGRCRSSGINSTSINSLDEVSAESHAGGLLRGVAHKGQLFLFGQGFLEPWQGDQPNASGFPFNRSTVIERGLAATHAVAGWEDNFASALIWAGSDNIVYHLRGNDPYRISTPTIERDLQNLEDKTTLRAFVAMHSGHPYLYLKSPAFTHAYDLLTSTWQERKSYGLDRFRAEQSVYMFGDWLLGDELNGDVYRLDEDVYTEDGDPLVFEVTSAVVEGFPMRRPVKRIDLNFVANASAPAVDANVTISWSEDGGATWSTPLIRTLWREGRFEDLITVKRCGHISAKGYRVKVMVSDPVYVGLLGGSIGVGE